MKQFNREKGTCMYKQTSLVLATPFFQYTILI